jgi:hypothetical protein
MSIVDTLAIPVMIGGIVGGVAASGAAATWLWNSDPKASVGERSGAIFGLGIGAMVLGGAIARASFGGAGEAAAGIELLKAAGCVFGGTVAVGGGLMFAVGGAGMGTYVAAKALS